MTRNRSAGNDQTTNRPSGQSHRDGFDGHDRRLGVAQWLDRVCAAWGGWSLAVLVGGGGVMAILARKCKCRMTRTAGMRLGRTGRHVAGVFSVRLMKLSRKIVINAHTALVADCGGFGNEPDHD